MNHLTDLGALLIGLSSVIAACASAYTSLQSYRNGNAIEVIRNNTNGLNAQLVEVTGQKRYEEGLAHGENNPRPRRRRIAKKKKG